MLRWIGIIIFLCSLPARAEEPPPRHDGAYVRLMLGGGYASFAESVNGADASVHGDGAAFDLHAGYFAIQNLAIGADLSVYVVPKPSLSMNGADMGQSASDLTLAGINASATYFLPHNFYGSVGIGIAVASASQGNQSIHSDTGFGTNGLLGKEWWISQHWGLGLAGQFFYMRIPDQAPSGGSVSANVFGGGVFLSSSYSGGR